MYSQDWNEMYPVGWLASQGATSGGDQSAAGALSVLYPQYVSDAKIFIDPDDPSHYAPVIKGEWSWNVTTGNPLDDQTGYTSGNGDSYAYAINCGEMTGVNTAILVDRAGLSGAWTFSILQSSGVTNGSNTQLLHGNDGVNATFVDGHDQWVPVEDVKGVSGLIPNWQNYSNVAGYIVNP